MKAQSSAQNHIERTGIPDNDRVVRMEMKEAMSQLIKIEASLTSHESTAT